MMDTLAETVAALSRWSAISFLAKATLALTVGLAAARLAGRARASLRHVLLASTFGALLALPLAIVAVPALAVELRVAAPTPATDSRGAEFRPAAKGVAAPSGIAVTAVAQATWALPVTWSSIALAVWLAGTAWLIASLLMAFWRLSRLTRHGLPWPQITNLLGRLTAEAGVTRQVTVLLHEQIVGPLTCGFRHATILLPADARQWSAADLRCALVHELEHVRRGDWAVQMAARAACACYWFHPLVWVAWRQLCLEAERACDDAVLGVARNTEYAEQLVQLAERLAQGPAQPALAMANRSDLSSRVRALLDHRQPRGRAGALASATALAAAAAMVVAIAPLRAVVVFEDESAITVESGQSARPSRRPTIRSLDRALVEAIGEREADSNDILELLASGADVNAAVDGDGSPLIVAARDGRIAIVRLLLERGADPNLGVPGDGNPLIMAAREGHAAIVTLLLESGAHIDQIVPGDENALIQASGTGHLAIVQLLVARGADVNARTWAEAAYERPGGEWRTPLSMARKGGHAGVVAFLVSAGARD